MVCSLSLGARRLLTLCEVVLDELGIADVQKELLVTKLVRKSKPLARILQDRELFLVVF
jgi:hypothetical protein